MGTHPIFESDFDCLTEIVLASIKWRRVGGGACPLSAAYGLLPIVVG